jgi:hypothetical protein
MIFGDMFQKKKMCLKSGKCGNFDKPKATNELVHFQGGPSTFQLPKWCLLQTP